MPQVVIANRLRDGVVVFLGTDGRWLETLAGCPASESEEASSALAQTAQKAVENQEVVGPELIEVQLEDGMLVPVKRREAIRATGPTIRLDLGKQAGN
jgi:hypothetical protein